MKEKLYIFDTTLRDGAQTYGVDFNVDEKKILSSKLDELGVDYIEGGWPGANATDTQFFNEKIEFKKSTFTSFGMTKKSGRSAENDPGLASLMNANTPSVCVVGKSWDFHVDVALEISNEENLENIAQSVSFLSKNNNLNDYISIFLIHLWAALAQNSRRDCTASYTHATLAHRIWNSSRWLGCSSKCSRAFLWGSGLRNPREAGFGSFP